LRYIRITSRSVLRRRGRTEICQQSSEAPRPRARLEAGTRQNYLATSRTIHENAHQLSFQPLPVRRAPLLCFFLFFLLSFFFPPRFLSSLLCSFFFLSSSLSLFFPFLFSLFFFPGGFFFAPSESKINQSNSLLKAPGGGNISRFASKKSKPPFGARGILFFSFFFSG